MPQVLFSKICQASVYPNISNPSKNPDSPILLARKRKIRKKGVSMTTPFPSDQLPTQICIPMARNSRRASPPSLDLASTATPASTFTAHDTKSDLGGVLFGAINVLAVVPVDSRGSGTAWDSDSTGPGGTFAAAVRDDAIGWYGLLGFVTVGCEFDEFVLALGTPGKGLRGLSERNIGDSRMRRRSDWMECGESLKDDGVSDAVFGGRSCISCS